MREFVGHKIKVAVEYLGILEGVVVEDQRDRVLIRGGDGKIARVIKAHVCAFTPVDVEPKDYVPFHVLYCNNKTMPCDGVRFIHEGAGVARKDFELFMADCPCRCDACEFGTKGELRSVNGSYLREMLANTMYGEHPNKKEVGNGKRVGKTDGTPQRSPVKSTGDVSGEKSSGG